LLSAILSFNLVVNYLEKASLLDLLLIKIELDFFNYRFWWNYYL